MQPNSNEVSTLNDIMNLIFKIPANSVKAVVYDVDLNFNLTKFYAAQYFLSSCPNASWFTVPTENLFVATIMSLPV